jgi:hypothetical protein
VKTLARVVRWNWIAQATLGLLLVQACQASGRGGSEATPSSAQAAVSESSGGDGNVHSDRHLLLVVAHDSAGFHVRHAQVVALALPVTRFSNPLRWRADVEDSLGKTLFSAALPAGGERRGEFAAADGGMIAAHFQADDFSFVLRVPLFERGARIHFWDASATATSGVRAAAVKSANDVDLGAVPYPADMK